MLKSLTYLTRLRHTDSEKMTKDPRRAILVTVPAAGLLVGGVAEGESCFELKKH